MVRVLKLATPHKVKRMKRNKLLLLCEAPKRPVLPRLRLPVLLPLSAPLPLPPFIQTTARMV